MDQAKTLSRHIGQRVRELREAHGARQEDLATAARKLGVRWNRAAIAALEAGKREFSIDEALVVLPLILSAATGAEVSPMDLLHGKATEWVAFTDALQLRLGDVRGLYAGQVPKITNRKLGHAVGWVIEHAAQLWEVAGEKLWPEADLQDVARAIAEGAGEAEQKAGRALHVPPSIVAMAAHGLWGRGFSAERDRRVEREAPEDAAPRSLQAIRGHVARKLLAELRPIVEEFAVTELPKPRPLKP